MKETRIPKLTRMWGLLETLTWDGGRSGGGLEAEVDFFFLREGRKRGGGSGVGI